MKKRQYVLHGPGMKEAVKKYHSQKANAKKRGIEWHFTFKAWHKWWVANLGPDWLKKRGPTGDLYVMARRGDSGVYIEGNVDCITAHQNMLDKHKNGRSGTGRPRGTGKWQTKEAIIEVEKLF